MNLEHHLRKSPEQVYEYLSDMQKFVSIHPVIHQMDPLGQGQYWVHERIKLLYIPWRFTYSATILVHSPKHIAMSATVMGVVHIAMDFVLKDTNDEGCLVLETVQFKSFLPVHWVMTQIFRKQHTELFRNMDNAK